MSLVLNNLTIYGRRHSKLFTNCHVSWETLYYNTKTIKKLSRRHFINSFNVFEILGLNNNISRKYKSNEIFSWIIKYSQNRTVLPHNFITEMITLNPITSATEPYNPEQRHKNAIDKLKSKSPSLNISCLQEYN